MMKSGYKKICFNLILIVSFFLSSVAFSASTLVKNVRISGVKQQSQFVFELTSPGKPGGAKYRLYGMSKPNRLVLDLTNARLAKPLSKIGLNRSVVKDIRSSVQNKNNVRIVFDLMQPVTFKAHLNPAFVSKSNSSQQLVINLTATKPLVSYASNASKWVPQKKFVKPNKPAIAPFKATKPRPVISPLPSSGVRNIPSVVVEPPRPKVVLKQNRFSRRKIVIVIDPGHGGKDPGAISRNGLREKDVVLAISQELYKLVNRERGFKAVLTRRGDYFIPLRYRLKIARDAKADMFVAIHADAFKTTSRGASVYALSQRGATSEAARWLAERENQSELLGSNHSSVTDKTLRSVLIDLSQTATIGASLEIGRSMLHYLGLISPLHYHRVEQAAFVVLKSPDIPSVLVETGFITNPYEARLLANPHYRKQLALAVLSGIKNYYMHHPPPGTFYAVEGT